MKTIRLRRKNCFTLLELLFVIAIIAILAGMLLPTLMHTRESANRAKCASNLTQIDMLLEMYARDYDGYMPPGAGPDGDIPTNDIYNTEKGYVGLGLLLYGTDSKKNPRIFLCPTATLSDDSEYVDNGFTAAYWNSYDNPFVKPDERGNYDSGYSFGGGPFGEVEDDYLVDDEEYDDDDDDDDDSGPVTKKVVKKIYKSSYIYRGYFGVDRKLRKNRGRALVMDYDFMFDSNKIHDTAEVLFMRERLTGSPELSDEEKAKLAAAEAAEEEEEEIGNYPEEAYGGIGADPFGGVGVMGDPFGGRFSPEGQLKSNHSGCINVFIHGKGLRRHIYRGDGNGWGTTKSDNVMTVKSQTITEFTRVFKNADGLK